MLTDVNLLIAMLMNQKDDLQTLLDVFNAASPDDKAEYVSKIESYLSGVSSLDCEVSQLNNSNEAIESLREDLSIMAFIAHSQVNDYK